MIRFQKIHQRWLSYLARVNQKKQTCSSSKGHCCLSLKMHSHWCL